MSQLNINISSIFLGILRNMDNIINETIRNLITNFKFSTLIMLALISFIYGILHSIGPGHGKTLVASFFLKEKHPLQKSLLLASIVSVIHTGSAVVLSFLLCFILTGIKGMFRIKMQSHFMAVSGILITVIGIFFLFLKILQKEETKTSTKNKNLFLIGFSAGIVPCPVALMIMLLAISRNITIIGLVSVISISIGMFFLLTIIGLISIKSRDGILLTLSRITKKSEIVSMIIEYISIILIILIGIGMSLKILLTIIK